MHEEALSKQREGVWKKPRFWEDQPMTSQPIFAWNYQKFDTPRSLQGYRDQLVAVLRMLWDGSSLIASDQGREVFLETMSTRSILSQSLSGIEETVEKLKQHWEEYAETGETIVFADDISEITYDVILKAVFGPGGLTEDETKKLSQSDEQCYEGTVCTSQWQADYKAHSIL